MSVNRLRGYLPGKDARIATARLENGVLIGYALAALFQKRACQINWVTQLVVHRDYRHRLVGSTILNSVWGFSNHFAWGIASANPYAIRALEKATRRRCDTKAILRSRRAVGKVLVQIPYLRNRPFRLSRSESIIDTDFHQDLSGIPEITPWPLGRINEGEEWLAVTFHDQKKLQWTPSELQRFMDMSGSIQREAYERMSAGNPQAHHAWAKPENAEGELDYLLGVIKAEPGARVLDFGCGGGRHSLALAKRGYHVTGVDFSQTALGSARLAAEKEGSPGSVEFIEADCRSVELNKQFNVGICLYDVIGSFPDDESNTHILKKLAQHVVSGGWIVFSVMSFDFIRSRAKYVCNSSNIQMKLDAIKASTLMQSSGEIFNPDCILLDTETHIVYRKEIFDEGSRLPTELIVRDRRYTMGELRRMCTSSGLTVEVCGFVKAGNFSLASENDQTPTKEILVIARKGLI